MWYGDPNFNVVLIVAILTALFLAIPILIGTWIYRNAQKRRESELIRLAIEKGQAPPKFPEPATSKYSTLRAALVWIGIGLGFMLMAIFGEFFKWSGFSIGFVPLFIGGALLIAWAIERKGAESNR